MRWSIPSEWDGERADKVLAHLSGHSRAASRLALEMGTVLLDDASVQPRYPVRAGSGFAGEIPDSYIPLEPEPVGFGVVWEDHYIAVIDKPSGVITHPGAGRRTGTLAAGLLHRWPQIRGVGADDRWGIVHRLDRDTSGLLVVGLTAKAYSGLSAAIKQHKVIREYLCLVNGTPASPIATIDAPISRDPRRPTRMRVEPGGRRAVTHYRVERSWKDLALLRVTLETGRTHQIRVHLASIGLPVAGDRTYGTSSAQHRLFLHATRLAFVHPVSGEKIDVEAPLPEDLLSVLPAER